MNPYAFPQSVPVSDECLNREGMTLRDYFAAHVLSSAYQLATSKGIEDGAKVAKECYTIADAMLAERAK